MVAELAGCSRGSFNNRKTGLDPSGQILDDPQGFHAWLKRIKASRKTASVAQDGLCYSEVEGPYARLEKLNNQLEAARRETKRQFDLRVEVERKLVKLTASYERLAKVHALQSDVVAQLNERLAALGGNPSPVVMFRTGDQP